MKNNLLLLELQVSKCLVTYFFFPNLIQEFRAGGSQSFSKYLECTIPRFEFQAKYICHWLVLQSSG